MTTLQQQIARLDLPLNEGVPITFRTSMGAVTGVVVVSVRGEQLLTLRGDNELKVYRVAGDQLKSQSSIRRPDSIAEFDKLCGTSPVRHEFRTRAYIPFLLTANAEHRELIEKFLALNPSPSDEQVHQFAASLGIDYRELEAQMFEMLAECVDGEESVIVTSASEDELVLEDKLDPRDASTKTALLHDPGIDPVLITEEHEALNEIPVSIGAAHEGH